jgi:thiamine-monophosphate kinase
MKPGLFLKRSGAKVGDLIFTTGKLGGSILGKHLKFTPRIEEARWLVKNVKINAMMDISDGISMDMQHILEESKVGACLIESAIPISASAKKQAPDSGKSPVEHALSDGEDFELLFTLCPTEAKKLKKFPFKCTVSQIGIIKKQVENLNWQRLDGLIEPLPFKGFEHK